MENEQKDNQYEIKVYKIWYDDAPDDFYIGSTKHDRLSKRMKQHRTSAKADSNLKIHRLMREKGITNFQYVQLASCMVKNKDEQRAFEQRCIDKLSPKLNSIRAFTKTESENKRKTEMQKRRRCKKKKDDIFLQMTDGNIREETIHDLFSYSPDQMKIIIKSLIEMVKFKLKEQKLKDENLI